MGFSKEFVWGAAASSYQIEGAAFEDGKGLSVWDTCCDWLGFVKDGDNGKVACDHYHKYKEDVGIMRELGLKAYRLSISWPRIMPDGTGRLSEKGLDFYDKLVDELLSNGIIPYVTLFHWDYPYELQNRGGWLNSDSPEWFAEYTSAVVKRLSDRVTHWMTQNEPQCYIGLGYKTGEHAPGLKRGLRECFKAGHNSLLGHGKATMAIRANAKKAAIIGYAPVGSVFCPATDALADIEAAKEATFSVIDQNFFNSSWWLDPVYLGSYPEQGLKAFEGFVPDIGANDMKIINQPIDFLGVNIYQANLACKGEDGKPKMAERPIGYSQTAFKWPVVPEALYWGPKFFYERYKKPILITENGMANADWIAVDGKVHDPQRIDFLYRYIREFKRAATDGVDAMGYFCWSFIDNFEWAEGYTQRFGLTYVDFNTLKRTIKDSGYWYRSVIETNGENII